MEQLPRLRARIASLEELRELLRAMRAMAASHVQEAQSALVGMRRYVEIVDANISNAVELMRDDADGTGLAGVPFGQTGASALIVVCSEHGFVGGFNDALLDRAAAGREAGRRLGIIGQRGAMLADERGMDVAWRFPMATHVGGVLGVTRRVADSLTDVARAAIVFGRYRAGGHYAVEERTILPIDPEVVHSSAPPGAPPLHHLEPATLLQQLGAEYLFAEITRAVMESLASENGARLQLLSAADKNIGDKLEDLHREENSLRQDGITAEMLDVVTGAEAVMSEPVPSARR